MAIKISGVPVISDDEQINVTGISTVGNNFHVGGDANVTGILTASSFKGDGSALTGVGGDITVQDEGSSLSTSATTLNFVGSGVVASGTGATKTITISGVDLATVIAALSSLP